MNATTSSRRLHAPSSVSRSPTFITFAPEIRQPSSSIGQVGCGASFSSPLRHRSKGEHCEPHVVIIKEEESPLIQACRNKEWALVSQLSVQHPEMARPQKLHNNTSEILLPSEQELDNTIQPHKRGRKNSSSCSTSYQYSSSSSSSSSFDLHHDTALGLVCRFAFDKDDTAFMLELVRVLLDAYPDQLQANQHAVGHTPLRDAVLNPHCPPQVLRVLLESDVHLDSVFRPDRQGLTPVDHLVLQLVQLQPQSNRTPTQMFQCYVNVVETQLRSNSTATTTTTTTTTTSNKRQQVLVSPLMRLLSLSDSHVVDDSKLLLTNPPPQKEEVQRVLECAQYLVSHNPGRMWQVSKTSGCTPLHVVLRNYGNCLDMVQFLLQQDPDNRLVSQRNVFGDLPLHVACLVGVPLPVLRLVIDKTVAAAAAAARNCPPPPRDDRLVVHSLLWTTNYAGRTPVDLEWMRHIEGGKGLWESRSFYPLEERGILFQNGRLEDMYRNLLQDAVQQIIGTTKTTSNHTDGDTTLPPTKQDTDALQTRATQISFGALFSRLVLLIQVAYRGCDTSQVIAANGSIVTDCLLHAASMLTTSSGGPTLPEPLLSLFLYLYKDQVSVKDHHGRLPLHCAMIHALPAAADDSSSSSSKSFPDPALVHFRQKQPMGPQVWIGKLLKENPAAAQATDNRGRLPLHYLLDNAAHARSPVDVPAMMQPQSVIMALLLPSPSLTLDGSTATSEQMAIIERMVDAFPESVERRDPVSRLLPFLQAAANPNLPVDVCFSLLQRAPSLLLPRNTMMQQLQSPL